MHDILFYTQREFNLIKCVVDKVNCEDIGISWE